MKKHWLILFVITFVNYIYAIGQTYSEIEKFYNNVAATHQLEKKLDGYDFYRITNKEAVEILGGCYHWGASGNGSLALVVGENETYAVLDFAQDLFPNPPYSNITGSVTEKAIFSHDGVWSVGKAGDKIIFRCFKCSLKIYLIDYKDTKWVGNHWNTPDKPTQFWFAISTRNIYAFRMGQMEWEAMTKENVRVGGNQTAEHVLTQLEAERRAELEAKAEAERKAKLEAERRVEQERLVKECTAQKRPEGALPNITLKDIYGKNVDIASLVNARRPIIISFFATWCKPCIREFNAIHKVYPHWRDDLGVEMYIVSIDKEQDSYKVKPFVEDNGWKYRVLLDHSGTLKRAMNVQTIPHTLIIDGKGKIVYNHAGYSEGYEDEIKKYLK